MVAQNSDQTSEMYELLDEMLIDYVNEEGSVHYSALSTDDRLPKYLALASELDLDVLSENDRLAFWINLYNVATLKLIVDNYPVKSIRRITPLRIPGISLTIPKVNSPWEKKFVVVGESRLSLDHIEHDIIRKEFAEPRIHFALVCAARSCPPLRREAYRGLMLNSQLNDQGIKFLTDPSKNRVDEEKARLRLSKIFKWFKEDFGDNDLLVQQYLAPFFDNEQIKSNLEKGTYDIRYLDYDWGLNDLDE